MCDPAASSPPMSAPHNESRPDMKMQAPFKHRGKSTDMLREEIENLNQELLLANQLLLQTPRAQRKDIAASLRTIESAISARRVEFEVARCDEAASTIQGGILGCKTRRHIADSLNQEDNDEDVTNPLLKELDDLKAAHETEMNVMQAMLELEEVV